MPVFNAWFKLSGSIRVTRTGNQNGTALKVGANLGAAGRAVRPSLRVSVVLGDGLSIVSSAPCGQRQRIRHYLVAICADGWHDAPSGRRKRTVCVDEILGFIAESARDRKEVCPMAPAPRFFWDEWSEHAPHALR